MKIVIRADASEQIGSGHIMRCLTLAEKLRELGNEIRFICRNFEGNLINFIKKKRFKVYVLKEISLKSQPTNIYECLTDLWEVDAQESIEYLVKNDIADLIIIDHYAIGNEWESKIRPFVKKIFVIDDLANRSHNCDYILDQNFFRNNDIRYEGLINQDSITLFGSKYALLREEFRNNKKELLEGNIKKVFVYFGAADTTNETEKVIKALIEIAEKFSFRASVVIGYSNPNAKVLKDLCKEYSFIDCFGHTNKMGILMEQADFAIGAGGSTTWERCCIGLPSIVKPVAENQMQPMKELSKAGAIILIEYTSIETYKEKIVECLSMSIDSINEIINCGFNLFDGLGVKRVANIIHEMRDKDGPSETL